MGMRYKAGAWKHARVVMAGSAQAATIGRLRQLGQHTSNWLLRGRTKRAANAAVTGISGAGGARHA